MYALLNLNPSEMVLIGDNSTTNTAISLALLPDLKADYLLVSASYGSSSMQNNKIALQRFENMKKDKLWGRIFAVEKGHIGIVDTTVWNAHRILAKACSMKSIYDLWGK